MWTREGSRSGATSRAAGFNLPASEAARSLRGARRRSNPEFSTRPWIASYGRVAAALPPRPSFNATAASRAFLHNTRGFILPSRSAKHRVPQVRMSAASQRSAGWILPHGCWVMRPQEDKNEAADAVVRAFQESCARCR